MIGDTKGLLSSTKKILIVDDSVFNGMQMQAVKAKIEKAGIRHEIMYAAVYVKPGSQKMVDYFYELLPTPRFFEWNVFHHTAMKHFCVDIDGVLCRDPTEEENDDGDMYGTFINDVESWIAPSKTIGWIVTCRLEKYRALTEKWLDKHGIKYKHLIMMDMPDKESRIKSGSHAEFKAHVYRNTYSTLFIESSMDQAVEIARLAGKEVLCMETREIISPGFTNINYHRCRRLSHMFLKNPRETLKTVRRHFTMH